MDYSAIKLPTTIKRVIDGDTIVGKIDHLLNIYSDNVRIRLAGIDAPSMKTNAGKESKLALQSKLDGQDIGLSFTKIKSRTGETETKKERYGRYLATVWIGERNINQEMIDGGFASVYTK